MARGVLREVTKEEESWLKENLRYDPDTGHLWWTKQNCGGRILNKPAGSLNCEGYTIVSYQHNGVQNKGKAHRLAWYFTYGVWPKDQIDHINNIRNDNRIVNLREATSFENQGNRKMQKGGTSQHKGVSWCKRTKKWLVQIQSNKRKINLGYYDIEKEAALAYNKAALEYFGDFAKINIIEPLDTSVTNTYISSSSGELTC